MKKSELVKYFNKLYNYKNQEEWDCCGPNYFNDNEVNNIYCSLDITDQIIDNAIKKNCNVIITHHPILVDELDSNNKINIQNKKLQEKLINNNILHICLHTCFDRYILGTSYQIFQSFNINSNLIKESKWLMDYIYYFEFKEQILLKDLVNIINNEYTRPISYIKEQENELIRKVGIGAGSCSSMLNEIINKVDVFLTGDIKWHTYLDAYNLKLKIININHYSESVFVDYISSNIENKFHIKCIKNKKTINIVNLI